MLLKFDYYILIGGFIVFWFTIINFVLYRLLTNCNFAYLVRCLLWPGKFTNKNTGNLYHVRRDYREKMGTTGFVCIKYDRPQ